MGIMVAMHGNPKPFLLTGITHHRQKARLLLWLGLMPTWTGWHEKAVGLVDWFGYAWDRQPLPASSCCKVCPV